MIFDLRKSIDRRIKESWVIYNFYKFPFASEYFYIHFQNFEGMKRKRKITRTLEIEYTFDSRVSEVVFLELKTSTSINDEPISKQSLYTYATENIENYCNRVITGFVRV